MRVSKLAKVDMKRLRPNILDGGKKSQRGYAKPCGAMNGRLQCFCCS